VKVAADPEQVDGTILDGRDYSSGQLPQENIRIIKEADATLRLNLGTQLDALYDRPHKEITNEGGTLIIIHDADSSLPTRRRCSSMQAIRTSGRPLHGRCMPVSRTVRG